MERPRNLPDSVGRDPSFAIRFISRAEGMNDKYGIADKLGLIDPLQREVLTMYLGLRILRSEVHNDSPKGFSTTGLVEPIVAEWHRLRQISNNPYGAALNSYEATYKDFIEEAYPENRDEVLRIQNSVTDLITRVSVRVQMHSLRGTLDFELWRPTQEIVRDWGMDWAGKISTQR